MKLKQQPEDFYVEELTDVVPTAQGPFGFYRLEKRGWTTPDAVQAIRRRWQLDLGRLSYGGLKDRHAHTVQYLTIFRGPQRRLTHHGVNVEYLGQVPAPYTSRDIRANRFRVVLRDLGAEDGAAAQQALEEVRGRGAQLFRRSAVWLGWSAWQVRGSLDGFGSLRGSSSAGAGRTLRA